MVDFIRPLALRMQQQQKRHAIEVCCTLTMVVSFVVWQYFTLPAKLSFEDEQLLRSGYPSVPALAPHPLYRQLQLLTALGMQFNELTDALEIPEDNYSQAQLPRLQLRRVQFQQETAKLTLFLQSALDVQTLTNQHFPNWEITQAEVQTLSSFLPYQWELTIHLAPVTPLELPYD